MLTIIICNHNQISLSIFRAQEVIQCHFEVQKSTIKLESTIIWRIGYQDKSTQASALPDEAQFHEQTISTSIPIAKSDQVTHLVAVMKVNLQQVFDEMLKIVEIFRQ